MQQMGSMPGGAGTMQPPFGAGSSLADEMRTDPASVRPVPGAPGPMDPPLADSMGATIQGGVDQGGTQGLLSAPQSDSERFFEDLKAFVADTEQLLRQARTVSGEGALAARAEFERRVAQAREGLDTARGVALERMNDWRDRTEAYVRRDPWRAVGIAAGTGFLLAMLSGRGRDDDE